MKTRLILCAAMMAALGLPASASTILFSAPGAVTGPFDVVVQAQDLFAGRDLATDLIISYGFNVSVSNPSILSFTGATSGSLFDPAQPEPGTNVFGAATGFGILPGAAVPLTLATLHFAVIGTGSANILITSDLSNSFQGLQFLNSPFQESIGKTIAVDATATPEPATFLLSAVGLIAAVCFRRIRR